MSGQGVVIDLSSVFSNPEALPLVQMAAASTLAGQMANLPAQGRRGILVDDEVWATMASERAAKTLQSRLKLCRLWGIWNILITHRLSDLNAQADSGTSASKVAEGLLADVQTRVVFRQATDQLAATGELLRMNDRLVELLPRLDPWPLRVDGRRASRSCSARHRSQRTRAGDLRYRRSDGCIGGT